MKDDQQVDSIVNGIIDYLKSKQALDLMPQIASRLTAESWIKTDPGLATVFSRVKLTTGQLKTIKSFLSRRYGRVIRVKSIIDASIIGGFKISLAGKTIDATINRRLEELKQKIIYD